MKWRKDEQQVNYSILEKGGINRKLLLDGGVTINYASPVKCNNLRLHLIAKE